MQADRVNESWQGRIAGCWGRNAHRDQTVATQPSRLIRIRFRLLGSIGRRLQAWLDQVTQRSRNRMEPLVERELSAVTTGRVLAEMTLCLAEGDHADAAAAQERLKQILPATFYQSLFP